MRAWAHGRMGACVACQLKWRCAAWPGGWCVLALQGWRCLFDQVARDWQESVQLVFDYFCERTPRSFVEARETSLVWNYKYAGALCAVRTRCTGAGAGAQAQAQCRWGRAASSPIAVCCRLHRTRFGVHLSACKCTHQCKGLHLHWTMQGRHTSAAVRAFMRECRACVRAQTWSLGASRRATCCSTCGPGLSATRRWRSSKVARASR